jgi:multidrug efflux pump
MRRMYGGKWISFLGIPPLTLVLIPLIFVTMIAHRFEVNRRRRRLADRSDTVNKSFIGSWF